MCGEFQVIYSLSCFDKCRTNAKEPTFMSGEIILFITIGMRSNDACDFQCIAVCLRLVSKERIVII